MTSNRDIEEAIKAANPVDPAAFERLKLDEAKRELFSGIVAEPRESAEPVELNPEKRSRRRSPFDLRNRRLAIGTVTGAVAATVLIVLGISLGSAGAPAPALGAGRARLAKFSPHILLRGPGWRSEAAYHVDGGTGVIRFHRNASGSPSIQLGGRLEIFTVQSALLEWSRESSATTERPSAVASPIGTSPVLGTQARIWRRAKPGHAEDKYFALWNQDGRHLEFKSAAPSLGSFEARLAALAGVDRNTWLAALPTGRLVRSGDFVASKSWGEPPQSAVAVAVGDCGKPLPSAVKAHARPSSLRFYEHQCGRL